jgi:hypothetical protein
MTTEKFIFSYKNGESQHCLSNEYCEVIFAESIEQAQKIADEKYADKGDGWYSTNRKVWTEKEYDEHILEIQQ